MPETVPPEGMVFVIDDDASLRRSLENLFASVDLRVQSFGSAAEFLQSKLVDDPSCLVLDVRLPGVSGLDFQAQLADANIRLPVIFITGHGDIPMTVRAMRAGAVEFLTKPFRDQDLLDAVQRSLEADRKRRELRDAGSELRARFASLTLREQEVIALVSLGLINKQVAAQLGVTEITVKVHRGNAMRKLGAKSLADLIRMAHVLDLKRSDGEAILLEKDRSG
jgi:FixJ family two-component response regulator